MMAIAGRKNFANFISFISFFTGGCSVTQSDHAEISNGNDKKKVTSWEAPFQYFLAMDMKRISRCFGAVFRPEWPRAEGARKLGSELTLG